MAEEYYPQSNTEDQADTAPAAEMDKGKDDAGDTSFLAPKSSFGGHEINPGDEFVFKVVKVYEDEVELEYAPEKPHDESMEDKPAMNESMGEMDKMPMSSMAGQ